MKNRLVFSLLLLMIWSCAKDLPKDPLVIPPNFAELPTAQDEEKANDESAVLKSEDKEDIKELKNLLLD